MKRTCRESGRGWCEHGRGHGGGGSCSPPQASHRGHNPMFPRIIFWKHCDNRKQCSRHCSCYNIERTLREHWEKEITLRKHAGNIHHPRCSQHVSSMFSSAILYQHFFSLLQCYLDVVLGNIEKCPLWHASLYVPMLSYTCKQQSLESTNASGGE